jgi:hypothetical protein
MEQAALLRDNMGPVDFASLEVGNMTLGVASPHEGSGQLYVHLGGKHRLPFKVVLTQVLEKRESDGKQARDLAYAIA